MKGKIVFLILVCIIFAGALFSMSWWNSAGNKDKRILQNRKSLPSTEQKVTVEVFDAPITLKDTKGNSAEAKNGAEVKEGYTVITGEEGRGQIVYPNGTVTRLDKNTEVTLSTLELSPQKVTVTVKKGQIWSRIAELLSDEAYKTTSTNVAATVKGTSYGHSLMAGGVDKIITTKGEVEGTCLKNSKAGTISKDHKIEFTCTSDPKAQSIDEGDKDEWYKFNNSEDAELNKRFGPFVYKDNGEVLGISDIASNVRKTADAVLNTLADNNTTSTTTTDSNGGTNPTNTPVPVSPGQPTNTPVPNATATPTPSALGYIKPLPNSIFGATVTSNGVSVPATDGMPIYAGDKVRTGGDTRVQVVMPPNSTTTCPDNPEDNTPTCTYTRLNSDTSVQVNSKTSSPAFNADVVVEAGKVWNRIKKLTGQETYDSQTGSDSGLVATVRGTSYGHSVGFENNELTDRLYTIEGLVSARCKKNPKKAGDVGKNVRAKFQCNKNDIVDIISDIASMDQDDIDWLVYNTKLDFPGQLEGNTPPTVTIKTPSRDLPDDVDTLDLNAQVTDDGKPFGGAAMVWTINGLPCVGICDNPFAEKTKVTFPASGVYTMKLTATDLSLSSSSEITVGVNIVKDNKPPVVNAGPDITITLPNKATLVGTTTDDGVPIKKVLVNWWTLVSGPASVSFSPSAFTASPIATFSKAGTYKLRLNSFDGMAQSFDDITIVVLPAPTPTPSPTNTPTPTLTPSPTPIPSPAAFIDISNDKKQATIRIENLFTLHSLLYSYSYDSDQGHKGVTGEKDPIENNRYEQLIPFGTCSSGLCVFNTGIGNVNLDVILKDSSNADVRHLHAEALTAPTATPTQTPTPTATPTLTPTNTPTPTPSGPQISSITMTSNTCFGTACNPTFQLSGQNLSTAMSYTIIKGTYNRSGNQISKTDANLNIIFPLTNKNTGYQIKVHFSSGIDITLPGPFNL